MLNNDYVAGLFDGEGCFCITKASNKGKTRTRPFYYTVTAVIEIREEFLVNELQKKYGGSKVHKRPRSENHSDMFMWKLKGEAVLPFCKEMEGRLLLKESQRRLVEDFLSIRKGKNSSPITDEEVEKQEIVRQAMQDSNKRGISRQLVPDNAISG